MSVSIVKSSNTFSIVEIAIVDWDITFNSKHYLTVEIIFNTDLDKVESDYTGTANESVIVDLYEDGTGQIDTLTYVSRTQTNDDLDSPATITDYIVDNNKLTVTFDYVSAGFLLGTDVTNKYLDLTIHSGDVTEKSFDTNDSNNQSGIGDRQIEDTTVESYTLTTANRLTASADTHDMVASAIRFNASDRVLIYPSGDSSEGLLSDNINSIVHESNSPSRDANKGYVYESTASFDFSPSYPGSLTEDLVYNVNSNSILAKIDKSSTATDELFDPEIDEIVCPMNNDWDDVALESSSSVGSAHTVYFPVLDGYVSGDAVTVTATFSGFTTLSAINGTTDNDTVNNGTVTFNFTFSQTNVEATDSGTIVIASSNGMNISKSVTMTSTFVP
jgi:hypothetical protein